MYQIVTYYIFISPILNFHFIGYIKSKFYFCIPSNGIKGRMAEWLGRGLQNLLQRFESASDLVFKDKKI